MNSTIFAKQLAKWRLEPDGTAFETNTSWLMPVSSLNGQAMLKIYKPQSDERTGADYLRYVDGEGGVRVFNADETAILIERLDCKRSLSDMAVNGKDNEVAEILADTVSKLHAPKFSPAPQTLKPLREHFQSLFNGYQDNSLLTFSMKIAQLLLSEPRDITPLHGDMHHENVLDGDKRGWLAIDPHALLGERTYEVANLLGNPRFCDDTVLHTDRMKRIARIYSDKLNLNFDRVIAFAIAHAGLSASWAYEDGRDPSFRLKCIEVLKPLLSTDYQVRRGPLSM